jgi:hypothetical protein
MHYLLVIFIRGIYYCISQALIKLHTVSKRRYHLDALFLFNFIFALNSILLFWKLLAFDFLDIISEKLLFLLSAVLVKIILLLDEFQLLMLFVWTLTYLEPYLLILIVFCNCTS